jgi:uncharacterized membrane protein YeaQ/YmgE (transglycosylase-associated protein family)
MDIVWTLLVGLVVGAVAKILMPGKDPGGIFVTSLIGVSGSALAGFLGSATGLSNWGNPQGFIGSVGGAILLLIAYRYTLGRP